MLLFTIYFNCFTPPRLTPYGNIRPMFQILPTQNRLKLKPLSLLIAFIVIVNSANLIRAEPFQDLYEIKVTPNNEWRPPFGLARIDGPVTVTVTTKQNWIPARGFHLDSYRNGKIVERHVVQFPKRAPLVVRKQLKSWPDEVVMRPAGSPAKEAKTIRQKIQPPAFEADAIAQPEEIINPVDLGVILSPENRLLLGPHQKAHVDFAIICRERDIPNGRIQVSFESNPSGLISKPIELKRNQRFTDKLKVPDQRKPDDVLQVAIYDDSNKELWSKKIITRSIQTPPTLPAFGATELKLDYELPIAVFKKGQGGKHTKLKYKDAWDPKFKDVVVSFPNGARFVFWRGASYIPFWAGRHNTGLSYEWAESSPPEEGGYVDAVEPLMDKELRYSRVKIIESTPAFVHVRWTYQSCDFNYKVWGDSMQEDFYFYPDGFGTRVLTINGTPGFEFEVSELIIITAAQAYPLNVLSNNLVDFIFLDGEKKELQFPQRARKATDFENPNTLPPIYRIRIHKDEKLSPIYFSPWDRSLPYRFYLPFESSGEMVTMAYWGSHWPLSRGQNTGRRGRVNDAIQFAPAHNSLMTWGSYLRPEPLEDELIEGIDALGKKRQLHRQVYAWLIGMTDANNAELLERARSYGTAPTLKIKGAKSVAWNPQKRSFNVDADQIRLKLIPHGVCINPAFEFGNRTGKLTEVKLAGRPIPQKDYAWDGNRLWLKAKLTSPQELELEFDKK